MVQSDKERGFGDVKLEACLHLSAFRCSFKPRPSVVMQDGAEVAACAK